MSASLFVTPDWLAAHLDDADLRVVDTSWYMPNMDRDGAAEYRAGHIPGAVYFDIDKFSDTAIDLPHMVAPPEQFAAAAGSLGICEKDRIVLYDAPGLASVARVWWNFSIMGARDLRILEGGLAAWVAAGHELSDAVPAPVPAVFTANPMAGMAATAADVLTALQNGTAQVVDMRSEGRFRGVEPEFRPDVASGHMPGAINLPFTELIDNGRLRPPADIRALLAARGIDPEKPLITTCGSGVTATILNLALASLGIESLKVYDGSWSEWGARADLPVVKG